MHALKKDEQPPWQEPGVAESSVTEVRPSTHGMSVCPPHKAGWCGLLLRFRLTLPAAQAYPLDLVRTRLAAQTTSRYYHGIGSTLATIVRDEGLRGLYRGMGPTLLQVVRRPAQGPVSPVAGCCRALRETCTGAPVLTLPQPASPAQTLAPAAHDSRGPRCCLQVPNLALNYCAYETLRSRWLCITHTDTPTVCSRELCTLSRPALCAMCCTCGRPLCA